jgi:hypothetical protein
MNSKGSKEKSANSDDGLLDDLESLLEEEGIELDDDGSAVAPVARARSTSRSSRSAREDRRSNDRQAFQNLETQMKLDPLGIQISEDRLTAALSRITADNDYEGIVGFINSRLAIALSVRLSHFPRRLHFSPN